MAIMNSEKKDFYVDSDAMKNKGNIIIHGFYLFFYSFVKYLSFPLSNYFRFCVIRLFSKKIKTKYIGDGVTIMFPWRVEIAATASLNRGTSIDGFGGVRIGCGTRIANDVSIYTADHVFDDPENMIMKQGYRCGEVIIEDDVWVGGRVCINKGVTIGTGSVIGSGAVVSKDIPPFSVAVGVPCRVIRQRN